MPRYLTCLIAAGIVIFCTLGILGGLFGLIDGRLGWPVRLVLLLVGAGSLWLANYVTTPRP